MLSLRLASLLAKAIPGLPLWDIGCDHAKLAEAAFFSEKFPAVHFVDPVALQIEKSRARLFRHLSGSVRSQAHFYPQVAETLAGPICGSVILAGMGGHRMQKILAAWDERQVGQASRLILSPHKDAPDLLEALRHWPQYRLVEETLVTERGRVRPILVFDQKI